MALASRKISKRAQKINKENKLFMIERKERQLAKLCQEIYDLNIGGRNFVPLYPFLLVRVLPKEQKTEGGIWLADTAQNKPVYEGIVLATWKPYVETREIYDSTKQFSGYSYIEHISDVKIGDRIVFPHYEGQGFKDFLDDKYYRLVREGVDQNKFPYMQVLGKLDYTGDAEVKSQIRKLTNTVGSVTTSGLHVARGSNPN